LEAAMPARASGARHPVLSRGGWRRVFRKWVLTRVGIERG